jgi:hypothetical protein
MSSFILEIDPSTSKQTGEGEHQTRLTLSNNPLVPSQSFFASSIRLSFVAVNNGGACGGVLYCFGAMLEFVIGLNPAAVFAGRKWLKSEESRGPRRVDVDARMKRMQVKRMRASRLERSRGEARIEVWAEGTPCLVNGKGSGNGMVWRLWFGLGMLKRVGRREWVQGSCRTWSWRLRGPECCRCGDQAQVRLAKCCNTSGSM